MPEGVEVAQRVDTRVVREVGAVDHMAGERGVGRDAGVDQRDVGGAAGDAVGADGGAQHVERGARRGGRVGRRAQHEAAIGVDGADSRSAAQRAHRATRHPGGEPADERDLTFDATAQGLHRTFGAVAGACVLHDDDARAALMRGRRRRHDGEQDGEGPEGGEGDPPANGMRRSFGHEASLDPAAAQDQGLAASACGPRELVGALARALADSPRAVRQSSGRGVRKVRRGADDTNCAKQTEQKPRPRQERPAARARGCAEP